MPLLVQIASHGLPGVSTIDAAFPSANTSGNTLIAVLGYSNSVFGAGGGVTLTDSNGNSWTLIQDLLDVGTGHVRGSLYLCTDCNGGANTVSGSNGSTPGVVGTGISLVVAEYSGLGTSPSVVSHTQVFDSTSGTVTIALSNHASVSLAVSDPNTTPPTSNFTIFGAVDLYGNSQELLVFYETGSNTILVTGTRQASVSPGGPLALEQITDSGASGAAHVGSSLFFDLAGPSGTITVSCDSPPDGTVGTSYAHTFPVTGGVAPYTFSVLAGTLPPGLSIDPATGIVSGIPTLSGTFPFVVDVSDSGVLTGSVSCSITIGGMTLGCGATPNGQVGVAYEDQLVVTAGVPPYVFSILSGELPPGLALNPATGEITGTPTTPGTYCFTVQVTEGAPAPGAGGFVNQVNVPVVHGLNSTSVSPGVWDDSGNVIKFGTVKLTDANNAVLTFPTPQSGSFKLSSDTYQQGFISATSVNVSHGLNSLHLIPVVYDGDNNVIDFGTFELIDANNAVLTFATAQDGNLVILLPAGAYSQTFAPASSIAVPHNLNSTLLRVAVYDPSGSLIAYESFGPVDANNSVLTFPAGSPQAGRVVVRVP